MDKKWKNLFLLGVTLIFSVVSLPAMATSSIMIIAPNKTQATLMVTGQATIQYTVTNNTGNPNPGIILSQLTIYPAFDAGNQVKKSASIQNNTCAGAKLTPGSNCTFNVVLTGNNKLPETFVLSPRVCAFNDATCSQPNESNRVTVTVANAFLAISDTHLNTTNSSTITYGEDTSTILWSSALDEITTLITDNRPRFITFTGDVPSHGVPFPNPSGHQKADIAAVLTSLSSLDAISKNNIPIFYAVGNNDSLVTDYGEFFDVSKNRNLFYLDPAHNSPATRGWPALNANPDCSVSPIFACTYTTTSPMPKAHAADMANAQSQGYYSAYPLGSTVPFRLISLNSVIFSRDYLYPNISSQTQLNEAQAEMDWLADQLASARDNDESVYIIMHIPVGLDAFSNNTVPYHDMWNTTLYLRNGLLFRDAFLALMIQYQNNIRAVISGHTHEDELRAFYPDKNLRKMEVLDVGVPGITANHFNNPGMQVYLYNYSFQLTEATTYYTNLIAIPAPPPYIWNSFSFKSDYACPLNSTMFSCMSMNILPNLTAWKGQAQCGAGSNPYEFDYSVRNSTYTPCSFSNWINILNAIQVIPIV